MSFLPFPAQNTSQAVALIKQDGALFHEMIHGDENSEVLTENGLVPSMQKVLNSFNYKYLDPLTFTTGATLNNNFDCLRRVSDGEYFRWAGPTPKVVAANTDPLTDSLYIAVGSGALRDVVEGLAETITPKFDNYSSMVLNADQVIKTAGTLVSTGCGRWKAISYPSGVAIANTSPQLYAIPLNGVWLMDFGADPTAMSDSRSALLACWSAAPFGSTIRYGTGQYYISGQVVHPLKQLFHKGGGVALGLPYNFGSYQTGTALIFRDPQVSAEAAWAIYMPPRDDGAPFDTCRYSSFSDMSFIGDGVSDSTGTRTLLKINNSGTNLKNITTRYGAVGIEVNYMVGASWSNVTSVAKQTAFWFRYDPLTPYDPLKNSVVTMCKFETITANCPAQLPNSFGWFVDATCLYGGNGHDCWDMEACDIGAQFEGRISAKDTPEFEALGAGAWKFGGNTFTNAWLERNTSYNLVLSYDPSGTPPALIFNGGFYQDRQAVLGTASTLVRVGDALYPLTPDTTEVPQGSIGVYGRPYTASQALLTGPEINSPLVRSLMNEVVPHLTGNRANTDVKSSFNFDCFVPTTPLTASAIEVARVQFAADIQSAAIEVTAVGTDYTSNHHAFFAKYLISNTNDVIASAEINKSHSGATQPFFIQAVRVGQNSAGIFLWKNASITSTTPCTVSLNIVIGGSISSVCQAIVTASI